MTDAERATSTYAFTFSRGEVALLAAAMAALSQPGAGLNPIGREVAARLRDGFVAAFEREGEPSPK